MDNAITVNRTKLLATLGNNLASHLEGVQKAQARYREKVIEELETRLTDARAGKPIDMALFARMPVPRSYAAEYEQAIAELRWHTGETIELSSRDFARLVLDKWEWAQHFATTNAVYLTE